VRPFVPYTPFIAAPRVLSLRERAPRPIATPTLATLCRLAGLKYRVTTPHTPTIRLHAGAEHLRGPRAYHVGIEGSFDRTPKSALRVLEVLAHGFHDYAARECVCGRGRELFSPPRRRGRPSTTGRPMTAAERMRRSRRRLTAGS